jgi:hypothetical protein
MLAEVKKCADNNDIKGLRYIFLDSLDVDPTFEKYKADYEYCKGIGGFFEPHTELTALLHDESRMNMQYWEQLKADLMKNFSSKRFEHMRSVARIVYADKVARLLSERQKEQSVVKEVRREPEISAQKVVTAPQVGEKQDKNALEKKRIEEDRRKIEIENQIAEANQRKQQERIAEARRKESEKQNNIAENGSKKGLGVVVILAAIIIIVLLIAALR